jgi:hypothetical protein
MAGNFQPLAIFFDISEKSRVQLQKAIVPDVGPNSLVQRPEMDTWHTTNANLDDLQNQAIERARNKVFLWDSLSLYTNEAKALV